MQNKNSKAFTLVELIVVITILAILGTIAFISLQGYSTSARNSRRISDINNIKTSLELFNVNSGQYPLPDNDEIVSYGGDELWYQGTIGENVTKNLSKNLNKKPLDPLYEIEYIYSVTSTKKEYELLSFYEGNNLTQTSPQPSPLRVEGVAGIISQTNASNTITPKIIGNYNQVYLKSEHYIIPTPSIINAEVNGTGMILNETNIKSQILTEQENIPNLNISGIENQIGKLDINLSVFTGTINKDSTTEQKILAIETIQNAYSGTTLGTSGIYKYMLSKTSDEEKEGLGDQMLLRKDFKYTTTSGEILTIINGECGSSSGMTLETEPTENLCTTGTSIGMTDGGIGSNYSWTCNGINGGTNSSCSASHISCTNITNSIKNYWKFNDIGMSDDFTGTSFNNNRWLIGGDGNVTQNNNIVLSGNGQSVTLTSLGNFYGDFDFQIDFSNFTSIRGDYNRIYLQFITNSGSISILRRNYIQNSYSDIISSVIDGNGVYLDQKSTNVGLTGVLNGKFNFKRNGTNVNIYYMDGNSGTWISLGSSSSWTTNSGVVKIGAVYSSGNNYSTNFDNFIVNSGDKLTDEKNLKNGSIQGLHSRPTGKIGNALSFNGTSNYVSLGTTGIVNPKVNTSGSISFWAKSNGNGVIYSEQEGTPSATLILTKNSFNIHNGTSFVTVNSPITINNGTWYHYVATWDSTKISLYVNGVGNSTPYSGTTQTFTKPLIGAYYSGLAIANYYNGEIDDFAIYNRVLTDAEIQKIYNDGNSGSTVCSY